SSSRARPGKQPRTAARGGRSGPPGRGGSRPPGWPRRWPPAGRRPTGRRPAPLRSCGPAAPWPARTSTSSLDGSGSGDVHADQRPEAGPAVAGGGGVVHVLAQEAADVGGQGQGPVGVAVRARDVGADLHEVLDLPLGG